MSHERPDNINDDRFDRSGQPGRSDGDAGDESVLDRLLESAQWPTPSDEATARLLALWQSMHGGARQPLPAEEALDETLDEALDEALDELLAAAEWPAMPAESVARLQQAWTALAPTTQAEQSGGKLAGKFGDGQHTRFRRTRWWSAAAALLVSLAGLSWWATDSRRLPPQVDRGQPVHTPDKRIACDADETPSWRPPNAFEQLLADAHQQRRRTATSRVARRDADHGVTPPPADQMPAEAQQWLAARVRDSRETLRLLTACAGKPPQVESMLIDRVGRSDGAQRLAALRVLAPRATGRSLPLLRDAVRSPELADVALGPWLRIEESPALGQFAAVTQDAGLRRQALQALWERDDPAAVEAAFRFAGAPQWRADAQAALQQAAGNPVDWLCEFMSVSPRAGERTLAAVLLGRLDRPEVTRRLIELTDNAATRQAAIAGLMASGEQSARGFLNSAEQDPYLVASIWTARRHQTQAGVPELGDSYDETQ